ncbi:MAG: YkgJ family cysteine cluster protein [Phycisphaerae bacterium]|nr:YkgJ family cysteine cluster protein [Phycisphaerae bacterium]
MTKDIHPCVKCGALCCKYFCFEIDEPDDYEEFDDVRWYLCHESVSVHIDEDDDWFIQIENRCNKLGEDNRCTIYDDRPIICRSYQHENCESTGADYGYREEFKTPEQLDAYAIKTLGQKTYEREMIKHRAKAEGISKPEMKQQLILMGRISLSSGKKKSKKKKKAKAKKL